jgi:bisanhydrobacterioruberin hydratase
MKNPISGSSRPGTETIAFAVYLLFFTVGSIGHHIEATRSLMLTLTPYTLLLFGASALLPDLFGKNGALLLWAAATYAFTFAAEAVGVATGAIFGSYRYGPTLGLAVVEVPLIIGYNWVLVVLGSVLVVKRLGERIGVSGAKRFVVMIASPILVGLIAVLFDLMLEPVAIAFDYWRWEGVAVPLENYVAWFAIAAIVSIPFFALKIESRSRVPVVYLAVQALFIASLLPLA